MKHYLVTGGSGYVGSMVVKELYKRAAEAGDSVQITAIVRDVEKARGILPNVVTLVESDIADLDAISDAIKRMDFPVDYIIHCAASTASSYMVSNPVETADGIVLGTRNMLELARRCRVNSMVYLSSMEVYGSVSDIGRPRTEEEIGEICLNSARSCYPLGKRMAEHYCYIYAKEYGVPVKVARLAQTFGTGVRPEDNRVYMQFARAVVEKKDIVLKTQGLSMGNYCAIEDVVSAILIILQKGVDGEAYNVVNESNTMCIKDMANLVAKQVAGDSIRVIIELDSADQTGYAPDTGLRLSGVKMRQLGWKPTKGLIEMYEDVIKTI